MRENFPHRLANPKITFHVVFLHIRRHRLPSILLVFENLAIDQPMSINDLVNTHLQRLLCTMTLLIFCETSPLIGLSMRVSRVDERGVKRT